MKIYLIGVSLMVIQSCSSQVKDTFNKEVLISSKQEKIYVNTLNWGLTDDNQISAISSKESKVQNRSDTLNIVKGLDPFIYTFKNDTLNLYFDGVVNYTISEKFKTIHVNYIAQNKLEYRKKQSKAYENKDGYHTVPTRKSQNYPSDMPKPSSN